MVHIGLPGYHGAGGRGEVHARPRDAGRLPATWDILLSSPRRRGHTAAEHRVTAPPAHLLVGFTFRTGVGLWESRVSAPVLFYKS